MSDTRSQIRTCIYNNPGIHFNAISRQLDIATGQTQYHLRRLSKKQRVNKESVCGKTHYYPPTYSEWERGAIALLRRETAREIVLLLLKQDEIQPARIATQLDLARSTIEWHLSQLIEYGIVTKEPRRSDQRDTLVVTLTNSSDIYRLLREIEPGLLDRLVDRFSRLTDELLDE